ncbi:MAG: hypothetical protein ACK5QW_03705, partial [Cyanobacteriota bacterium]
MRAPAPAQRRQHRSRRLQMPRRLVALGACLGLLSPLLPLGSGAAKATPALTPIQGWPRTVPVMPLPPLTPALGSPQLGEVASCPGLQERLSALLA